MSEIDTRLVELGILLPTPPEPVGAYAAAIEEDGILYLSGQLPLRDGTMFYAGKLGAELSLPDGYAAARLATINLLARIRKSLGGFERLKRIARIEGYFSVVEGFAELPAALDGCSDLIADVLGDRAPHTRTVFGVCSLPLNAAVELSATCVLECKKQASLNGSKN